MTIIEELRQDFEGLENKENAQKMAAYMRNQFEFYGIRTPQRNQMFKPYLKRLKETNKIDWDLLKEMWNQPQREWQYFVCHVIKELRSNLRAADINQQLQYFIVTKSWWDTIDSLDKIIGNIEYPSDEVNQIMEEWSIADNLWMRRIAIDHQLLRKEKMNEELLTRILNNNLGQTDFFIRKAMGWILRDYSKTNPSFVQAYLDKYQAKLAPLTIREASKYLKKDEKK